MADGGDDDGQERTEEASQQRRDEWRNEGQVAQSRELSSALVLLATTGILYAASSWTAKGFGELFEASFHEIARVARSDFNISLVMVITTYSLKIFTIILAPIALGAMVVGIVCSVLQTGFIWTTKPLDLDFEKLNPINGVKRLFGWDGFFDLFKAVAKFLVIGAVLYGVTRKWIPASGGLWGAEPNAAMWFTGKHLIHAMFAIGLSMLVLSILDFAFQKIRYEQRIKMTKQEAREDRKQQEGDPMIKARIRGIQRQIASRRMMDAVKKADVVITNPTHIAIALIYDRENMLAPKVVAKGADFVAEQIKKIAREHGVPCVENVPLARAMYKALKVGQMISRDLYNAVAEVLAYVYRIKGRNL